MASYEQRGQKICPKCKTKCTTKKCPKCGATAKNNGKWTVRFNVVEFDKLTNKRLSGFDTKKEAEAAYNEFTKSQPLNVGNDLNMQELCDSYNAFIETRLKTSSVVRKKSIIKLYILPYFKKYKVKDITTKDIIDWQAEIVKHNFKFRYMDSIHSVFCAIINYGIKYHNLSKNIVSEAGNFKNTQPKHEMNYWTQTEFEKFINVVDDKSDKVFFSFLYLTGCRKGEAYALNWHDINFNTKIVKIRKNLNIRGIKKGYEITTPKNTSSNRDILMPDNLINLLKEHYDNCKKINNFNDDCFVFGVDKPLRTETVRQHLIRFANKAKVKKIRIHDFRHSHASLLINKGQNILIVAQRLGHSDVQMTLNTYSHLFPNAQAEIIKALNVKLG